MDDDTTQRDNAYGVGSQISLTSFKNQLSVLIADTPIPTTAIFPRLPDRIIR